MEGGSPSRQVSPSRPSGFGLSGHTLFARLMAQNKLKPVSVRHHPGFRLAPSFLVPSCPTARTVALATALLHGHRNAIFPICSPSPGLGLAIQNRLRGVETTCRACQACARLAAESPPSAQPIKFSTSPGDRRRGGSRDQTKAQAQSRPCFTIHFHGLTRLFFEADINVEHALVR